MQSISNVFWTLSIGALTTNLFKGATIISDTVM